MANLPQPDDDGTPTGAGANPVSFKEPQVYTLVATPRCNPLLPSPAPWHTADACTKSGAEG